MNFLNNKKGQGMSTNTIVLLILGLILLVALIFGFATGWKTFSNIANPTNIDSLVEDCQVACSLGNEYAFCSSERNLRINEQDTKIKTSCYVLSGLDEYASYFGACPGIQCELKCDQIMFNDEPGTSVPGKYDVSSLVTPQTDCFVN